MLNKPTYLLICLIEECAEIIQRCCKAIRFGFDEIQPEQNLNNLQRIHGEIVDLNGILKMVDTELGTEFHGMNPDGERSKIAKVKSLMPLSIERGMLEPEEPNQ